MTKEVIDERETEEQEQKQSAVEQQRLVRMIGQTVEQPVKNVIHGHGIAGVDNCHSS